jgi:hypothetical protein
MWGERDVWRRSQVSRILKAAALSDKTRISKGWFLLTFVIKDAGISGVDSF